KNRLQILHSQIAIQKGDLQAALVELKAVAAGTEQDSSTAMPSSGIEARRLLGALSEKLRYWDLAASSWSSLTVHAPHLGEAHRRAGLAYLKIRQPSKAVFHLERYLKPTPPNAWSPRKDGWLTLLQSHLRLQLQRTSQSQNWAEFIETLEQVQKRLPGRWEICFAEADYLLALGTPEASEKASRLLVAAEKEYSSEPGFWRNLVRGYGNLKNIEAAERALKKYGELESDPIKRGLARANLLTNSKQYDEAEAVIVGLLAASDPKTTQALQFQRVQIMLAAKEVEKAKDLLKELIASHSDNPRLLSLGIEVMLNAGELAIAESWENQLQNLPLAEDYLWQYFRARRFLHAFKSLSKSERSELRQLIASLRSSRPGWHSVVGLEAHYAELRGDALQAIEKYQLAIKLGDSNSDTLKRLVLLLNKEGRFTDADNYLSLLSTRQGGTLQVESLEISSALRNHQVQEAVELARDAVERHPGDPQRLVWLASLLSLDKQSEAAEKVYRDALLEFPKDLRLRNGLFALFVKSQQLDKASAVLETLVQSLEAEPTKKHFALANGYLQLGNQKRAVAECELALEADPSHLACRLLHAKLLMTTDTPNAEKQLEEILKRDNNHGEAKRLLASIWTSRGGLADTKRAMKLLDTLGAESALEHQANNRLRAQLLSRQGRSEEDRRENITSARRIIEEQIKHSKPPVDVDRLLLAKIYEAEVLLGGNLSSLQASREQWQLLLDRPKPIVQYQLQYLEFLFRQLSRPPGDTKRLGDWESLRETFLIDLTTRVTSLEDSQREIPASMPRLQVLGYRVRLEKVQGNLSVACQLLDEFAEQTLPEVEASVGKARSHLVMGNLYASLKQHQQAAEWYRKLSEIAPQTYVLLVRELAA
ncbi:MAG: tetratricopeptide repeat protein, partial [Planctomycetota bacterium]